jgi:hypothetical protein
MNIRARKQRVGDLYIETDGVRNAKEVLDREEYWMLGDADRWCVREQLTADALTAHDTLYSRGTSQLSRTRN